MTPLITSILGIVLAIAVFTDVRAMRIPNWLTGGACVAFLILHGITHGPDAALLSLAGLGVGCAVMLIPYAMGVMGAGDVKLTAACGAALGPSGALLTILFTSLAGGVYAIGVLALTRGWPVVAASVPFGLPQPPAHIGAEETSPKLRYGVAIAVGAGVACWRLVSGDVLFGELPFGLTV